MDNGYSIVVRVHWTTRVLFSIGLIAIAYSMMEWLFHPMSGVAIRLLVEICLDFGLWKLATSYIEANIEYVRVNVFYGTFEIRWQEVKAIILSGAFTAFVGQDKRVVVSLAFTGAKTQEFIELIQERAKTYQIEIRLLQPGEKFPLTHQNSRV